MLWRIALEIVGAGVIVFAVVAVGLVLAGLLV